MLDGRTAYETYHRLAASGSVTPFGSLSAHGRERWQRVEEAIRLEAIKPIAGWREADAEDPHGKRYDCKRQQLAGGHLTDDQAAWAVAMADRNDPGLEGVLAVARDRIRWLSRQLHALKASLEATVRDATGMREELALRASKITALEFDRELPPLGLPPGALQAYSEAYGTARKGANHLEAHSAALRAVLEARPTPNVIRVLRLAAPFVDHCCGEGIHPLWDGAYLDPIPVHDEMAKALDIEALYHLQQNPDAPAPATPYTVIGKTFDGVEILAPATVSEHFTTEEIQEAIRFAIAKVRGPRSGDMADVVDAINGETVR